MTRHICFWALLTLIASQTNAGAQGLDPSGRWKDKGSIEGPSMVSLMDITPCSAGWCAVTVSEGERCAEKFMVLTRDGVPQNGVQSLKGEMTVKKTQFNVVGNLSEDGLVLRAREVPSMSRTLLLLTGRFDRTGPARCTAPVS